MDARVEPTPPSAVATLLGLSPADPMGIPVAEEGLPLMGHTLYVVKDSLSYIRGLRERHGEMCWVRIHPEGWGILLLDPAHFEVLRKRFTSVAHYSEIGEILLGHSLLTRDGEEHRSVRQALQGSFTPKGLTAAGVGEIMAEVVTEHAARLVKAGAFTALSETRDLALTIIFRVLGIATDDVPTWRRHYEDVTLSMFPVKAELPGLPAWKARRGRDWVEDRLRGLVAEVREDPTRQGLMADMVRDWDLQDPRPPDSWLVDNILLLALAGHETTASTMAWMLAFLAEDADLWARVVAEARAVGAVPRTPADLARFPLAEGVFREALRLYPPVPVVTRRVAEPGEFAGRHLPAGTIVRVPILALCRDPALYPDPDAFKPERWAGMDRRLAPIETLAFSYGPHFCLGYHVAWMEAVQMAVALALAAEEGQRPLLKGAFPRARFLGLCSPTKGDTRMSFG